jgi:hypothetical protein
MDLYSIDAILNWRKMNTQKYRAIRGLRRRPVPKIQENSSLVTSFSTLNLDVDQSLNMFIRKRRLRGSLRGLKACLTSHHFFCWSGRDDSFQARKHLGFTIYVHPHKKTYLTDIHSLQEKAFRMSSDQGQNLLSILESHLFLRKLTWFVKAVCKVSEQ